MAPDVSIIVLNYNHPEHISRLLFSLEMTEGVSYEVVVVDNGSLEHNVRFLEWFKEAGLIDRLTLSRTNLFFSAGNNLGVSVSDPQSKYILLLNSDIEILRSDWLAKLVVWMEGVPELTPCGTEPRCPAVPSPGPRDILSLGWSSDPNVPGHARPEGYCCLFRRGVYRDMSPDFPFHYGFEEMVGHAMQAGASAGVLCGSRYIRHIVGGSGWKDMTDRPRHLRQPDIPGWFRGTLPETLDFTFDPQIQSHSFVRW